MAFLCKYKPLKWQLTLQIGIKHWSGDRILTGPHSVQPAWREPRRRKGEEGVEKEEWKEWVSKQIPWAPVCCVCGRPILLLPIKLWPLGMKSGKRDSERQTQAWDYGWWQEMGEIWKNGYFTQGGRSDLKCRYERCSSVPVTGMCICLTTNPALTHTDMCLSIILFLSSSQTEKWQLHKINNVNWYFEVKKWQTYRIQIFDNLTGFHENLLRIQLDVMHLCVWQ